ncbi:MAG: NAD(P)H-hydrate dehydratase, partial [Streptosporangiaceae bacterium]
TTVIASPGRPTALVNPTGTPWLATAGTGDVLSGLAGALLAQGLAPAQAGLAAAYLHGMAGRLGAAGRTGPLAALAPPQRATESPDGAGEAPIGASDLVRALSAAFRSL